MAAIVTLVTLNMKNTQSAFLHRFSHFRSELLREESNPEDVSSSSISCTRGSGKEGTERIINLGY